MKVSWPLSSREAVIHYFVFEYFQDDLMVVLLNSISDSETIERRSHGFTRDEIPDVEEVVRVDVVGGFALQKVTADRSYFRTIANMDVKLDFVPPSLINFVSRQLIGSGFKLYKKEVASVSRGDQKFCEALKDPFYSHIRKALDSESSTEPQVVENDHKRSTFRERSEEETSEELKENDGEGNETRDSSALKPSDRPFNEKGSEEEDGPSTDETTECSRNETRKKVVTSTEVEKALDILEKAISIYKEKRMSNGLNSTNLNHDDEIISLENHASRRETNHSKIVPSDCESSALQRVESNNNESKNKKHRFCCLHFYQY